MTRRWKVALQRREDQVKVKWLYFIEVMAGKLTSRWSRYKEKMATQHKDGDDVDTERERDIEQKKKAKA